MNKAIVIDGNSLLFRAYYATAYGPNPSIMRNKEGIPTNAIFAFANMLNKILLTLKEGDAIFVGFDTDKKTFRHEEDKDYKANRKECPQELKVQMPLARELLKALNIFTYEKEGYEADDICGTYAKKASKEGYKVIVYTSDKDYLQLIDENITVSLLKVGLSNMLVMDENKMEEIYGFKPMQIIDYKALRGDSSDNLPGIPGIGEKTAIKLIKEYQTFDEIVKNASSIGGKVGQSIMENEQLGRMCYHLASIDINVDMPFSISDSVYEGYEFDNINKFCNKFELKQFLNRLPNNLAKKGDKEELTYQKIVTFKGLDLASDIGIALDIEPGNYNEAVIYGLALTNKEENYYIDIEDLKKDETIKGILKDKDIHKYCYDFKAIKVALSHLNIDVDGLYFDALLAIYILDTSLKGDANSTFRYFGYNIDKTSENELSLFDNSNPLRTVKMANYSLKMAHKAFAEIEKLGCLNLYKDVDLELANVLSEMEIEGFPLNVETLKEIGKSYEANLENAKKSVHAFAGEEFNIDSPKQVKEILFEKLKIAPKDKYNSTSVEVLNELKKYHPIVEAILQYRKYAKLMSTYVSSLTNHVYKDGKIHALFNQALTTTGRLSSSEPNLQNISVRDEEGKLIRKAFYYPDDKYSILSLDYSQIELRILASLANCKALQEVFLEGKDIHASTASKIFHTDNVTSEERRRAKAVNFGIIYGISTWGLAEQISCSNKEAKSIIDSFYNAYPEVGQYFEKITKDASKDGYVTTLLGRRRYLRELSDSNYQVREFARRAAMNAPIQGTAADLIKIAMIKVNKALKEKNLQSKMILQIHDELLFKVPEEEKDIVLPLVKQIMENALDLNVKLEVDGGYGRTFYDCK